MCLNFDFDYIFYEINGNNDFNIYLINIYLQIYMH